MSYTALLIGTLGLAALTDVLHPTGALDAALAIGTTVLWIVLLVTTCVLAGGWLIVAVERGMAPVSHPYPAPGCQL